MRIYDAILLLTGEDHNRFRSKKAIDLFNKGNTGYIFVTGGYGGFGSTGQEEPEAVQTEKYLMEHGVPESKIFTDGRSRETLGNFSFPETHPIDGNPRLSELEGLLLVTEKKHMPRALQYAAKVLPPKHLDFEASLGNYRPGIVTKAYNTALLHALRRINGPDAQAAHAFLCEKHPFYQEGWFAKPDWKRKLTVGWTALKWLVT